MRSDGRSLESNTRMLLDSPPRKHQWICYTYHRDCLSDDQACAEVNSKQTVSRKPETFIDEQFQSFGDRLDSARRRYHGRKPSTDMNGDDQSEDTPVDGIDPHNACSGVRIRVDLKLVATTNIAGFNPA